MPVTRQQGGGRSLADLIYGSETSAQRDSQDNVESSRTPASQTSATDQATGTDATTIATTSSTTVTPPSQESRPAAPPPTRSVKSTSSRRTARIAKAREEVLRIKLELAQARVAAIEAESDEEDGATLISAHTEKRVDEWLTSQQHVLALTEIPHNEENEHGPPQPAGPKETPQHIRHSQAGFGANIAGPLSGTPPPVATTWAHGYTGAPLSAAAPIFTPKEHIEVPPPPPKHSYASAGQEKAIVAANQVNLTDLASAIAIAARAGNTSRYNAELPPFSGSHQEWLSFKASYEETRTTYSETENVSRLRKCLKGKAKEAVENLLIYHGRAEEIISTLESRFGRPDSIALHELERLRALPRLSDGPRDICTFACRVANTIATLRALNRIQYLYSPETVKAVIDKLTPAQRYRWYDYAASHQDEEPELLKISTFLTREANYCAPYAPPETEATGQSQQAKRTQKTFSTMEKTFKCACCNDENHSIEKCQKFASETIEERWKIAKNKRLCFRCLRFRSKTHTCKRLKCEQDDCEYYHHSLLHYKKKKEHVIEAVTSTWSPRNTRAYLKIVPIKVYGPAGVLSTFALLDDGSTVTLIDEDVAQQVGLEGPTEPLFIEAIANQKIDASRSRYVSLNIRGHDKEVKIRARTMNDLQLSAQVITDDDIQACDHLSDIRDHLKYEPGEPRIIIGQDNWHLLITSEIRQGRPGQPVASLTPLGWVLHGTNTRLTGRRIETSNHMKIHRGDDIDNQLSEYFAIENLLIQPKRPQNDPEQRATAQLEKFTRQTSTGNYEVPLLWKNEELKMPENYENTLKRLYNMEQKLDKNETFKKRYNEEMEAFVAKGYAERAQPVKNEKRVWYLPHFAVLNPMKPEKVRIVHDAAAKTKGVSLNDCLLTGPDLLQSLPGVLMRFRQHPVAVGADIAEMFMQVKVREDDRNALRYLWRGDRRDDMPPEEYRMTSLIFGATCSPSIAIYVKNTNAELHRSSHPEAADAIIRNHYVDDYLQSFKTKEDAIRVASEVRDIHTRAHYNLRQWTSNSPEVLQAVASEQGSAIDIELSKSEMKNERVLGQVWKPSTDEIAFNLDLSRLPPNALDEREPTKRQLLKIMMSVFDPLGLASPVTIEAKKILQEVWRRGTEWDNKIDSDLGERWVQWTNQLRALRDVAIPRCYAYYGVAHTRELHTYVDASSTAYTCALYWRVTTEDGSVHVSLITAKAKVAPLKLTSIPRLELQAATMGSRMAAAVIEEHDIKPDRRTFWSDSRTVLAWIRNGSRTYKSFVAHRIAAIEETTKISEWRWVPTKLNVADEATRDAPSDFDNTHRWFNGPDYLRDDPATWPVESPQPPDSGTDEEIKIVKCNVMTRSTWLPSAEKFSKWERLLRTVGRVLQFIELCRPRRVNTHYKRTKKNKEADSDWRLQNKAPQNKAPVRAERKEARKFITLSAAHLLAAENIIIRGSQRDAFADEEADLRRGRPPAPQSRLRTLAVEVVDGLLVLKTRINAAEGIPEQMKKPAVLDGKHPATKLYIDFIHRQLHHSGVDAVVNECKQHYCILRLRTVARGIVHNCLPCRRRRARPTVPSTGNHPRSRLAHHERPFKFTGLDYFGPLTVTVGRGTQKRYVALFTCLTVRAIHLEVVPSLSGDSAVMALRRFIARRGCPTEIWSDNGTNFHAADKELRRAATEAEKQEASSRLIHWRYIPPSSPFMGGGWERMVRSTKEALYAVLKENRPSEEVLATLLSEVEFTVNNRPLTHVSVDPEEPESLTPNHFLMGGSGRMPQPGSYTDGDLIGRATWRTSQRLADHFWTRWVREYLPTLQNRREPYGRGRPIELGDVVLIADGTMPRNAWPMGRVVNTYPGPDGVTRVVDVQTKGGVLRRSTKKLVILPTKPVDVHAEEVHHSSE